VESAVLTHPELVRAVIWIVKEQGATCSVGDSSAVTPVELAGRIGGIKKVCQEENVPLIDLKIPCKKETPKGKIARFLYIAKEIYDFDSIINLPKMKNHNLTGITIAMKNLYGVIPGLRKAKYHLRYKKLDQFSSLFVELNQLVQPVINIVDGIISMEGDGPVSGEPRPIGLIIMGDNTVAVDYVCAKIMNYDLEKLSIIQKAKEYKWGGYTRNLISIKGENLEKCIVPDFKKTSGRKDNKLLPFPNFWKDILSAFLIKKPVINKKVCTGCGECAKICPPQTISIINKKAVITYKSCIKCYCCSEVCPQNAIYLKIKLFV